MPLEEHMNDKSTPAYDSDVYIAAYLALIMLCTTVVRISSARSVTAHLRNENSVFTSHFAADVRKFRRLHAKGEKPTAQAPRRRLAGPLPQLAQRQRGAPWAASSLHAPPVLPGGPTGAASVACYLCSTDVSGPVDFKWMVGLSGKHVKLV